MMVALLKEDEDKMLNQFSEIDAQDVDEDKIRTTTAKAMVPSFPAYTQSIKKQNQSRFGAQSTNPLYAASMRNALERHEQELMEKAYENEKNRQDFEDNIKFDQVFVDR